MMDRLRELASLLYEIENKDKGSYRFRNCGIGVAWVHDGGTDVVLVTSGDQGMGVVEHARVTGLTEERLVEMYHNVGGWLV